jgi:type II secretory pathway pseudopilin PulG
MALLASIILAALNGAKSKGRDASKQEEVWQINNAIQLYMAANNGNAPTLNNTCAPSSSGPDSASFSNCIAKSYDDSNLAWDKFVLDISSYISLPSASCISNCSYGPGYVYVAPRVMQYYYSATYNSTVSNFSGTYQLYTNLENGQQQGYKSQADPFLNGSNLFYQITANINGTQVPLANNNFCLVQVNSDTVLGGFHGTGGCVFSGLLPLPGPGTYYINNWNGILPVGATRFVNVTPSSAYISSGVQVFTVNFQ